MSRFQIQDLKADAVETSIAYCPSAGRCVLEAKKTKKRRPFVHKYLDNKESSAEILRLVLPMMAQHPAAFHPLSYALWYEYMAGRNSPLNERVDIALQAGEPFDEEKVASLYVQFIAEPDIAENRRMQVSLERIVADLTKLVTLAGIRASDYNDSLEQYGDTLKRGVDVPALEALVQSLIEATQAMRTSSATLQEELESRNQAVEELRAELARARQEAHTDPLTGILNRRGLEVAIEKAGTGANGDGLDGSCLIMLDIDEFKRCNDSYGHVFGDKVIRVVAKVLTNNVKGRDAVARIGGEEFAVFLPQTPLHGARVLAETLRQTVEKGRIKRVESAETISNITVSLGVAAYQSGETIENFMQRADRALYASKKGGRNRVIVFEAPAESAVANHSKQPENA
jgi:diguanylate cyclase